MVRVWENWWIAAGTGVNVKFKSNLGSKQHTLQALLQDGTLALKADVLGPANEARQIAASADVTTDAEILRILQTKAI